MDLMQNVFKDYDISSLKIFYTILRFMKMEQLITEQDSKAHPTGYYHCELHIREIAKAINYKARHIERLENLGKKASEVFHRGIGTKGDEVDEFGNYEYETIHPIYRHKYKDGMFSVDIPVSVFEDLNTFFLIEKIDELMKLDDKITFRLYQILFSNIKKGTFTIHLNHFNSLMGTSYANRDLSLKIKEAIKEINDKTDISIDNKSIEPVYKKENAREKLVSLKLNYSRKTAEPKENASIKSILAESIEKTCLNRFFDKKYKTNISLHNSVINNLITEFSEDIVLKALASIRKDLNVDIARSLQAYMTKCCHTEAENIRILQEIETEKQQKIEAEKEVEKQQEIEIQEKKSSNDEIWATFENMNETEKAETIEKAAQYYLKQSEAEKFIPVTKAIFDKNIKAYIISVLKGA